MIGELLGKGLTGMQAECIALSVKGKSYREIAAELESRPSRVCEAIGRAVEKLPELRALIPKPGRPRSRFVQYDVSKV